MLERASMVGAEGQELEHKEKCILCVWRFAVLSSRTGGFSVEPAECSGLGGEEELGYCTAQGTGGGEGAWEAASSRSSSLTLRGLRKAGDGQRGWATVKQEVMLAKGGSDARGSSQGPSDRGEGRRPIRPESPLPV